MASSSSSTYQEAELLMGLSGGMFVDDDDAETGENMDVAQVPEVPEVPQQTIEEELYGKQWKSFEYTVPWTEVDLSIRRDLDASERAQTPADMKDFKGLKQWIMCDLYNKYETFKEFYIVKTKTPGMKIYESVASQVIEKYKCIENFAEKTGYALFLQSFSTAMENKGRRAKEVPQLTPIVRPTRRAVQAKGTAGVIPAEYNPEVTEEMEEDQLELKMRLQNIKTTKRRNNWDTQTITRLMHQSYELQRKEITESLKNLKKDNPDIDSEMKKLKDNWPFLFELRWQNLHFLRLCGHNLQLPVEDYCQQHLRTLIQYLCSPSTESGIRNIKELWKWEDAGRNLNGCLLLAIHMLSNHFQENFGQLVKTAEKTSPHYDLVSSVPEITGDLTIIALDYNMYLADKFYICLDREVVLTSETSIDAFTGLIQTAFIFDAHYPEKMKFTFEFLERVICRLGAENTMRKGHVLTMSATVTRAVNNLEKFSQKLSQN